MFTIINGRKITARRFFLEALTNAHEELAALGIGFGDKLGFVLSDETSGSWRSEAYQRQLLEKGSSKTMYSNHRRGTAVDCAADWPYIKRIRPTMNKYGLVNDLAYITAVDPLTGKTKTGRPIETDDDKFPGSVPWDGGHFNWKSNTEAQKYEIINKLPVTLNQFSMNQYDGQILFMAEKGHPGISGAFAGVYPDEETHILEKHIIKKERAGLAAIHPLIGARKAVSVDLHTWDSIPTGKDF